MMVRSRITQTEDLKELRGVARKKRGSARLAGEVMLVLMKVHVQI